MFSILVIAIAFPIINTRAKKSVPSSITIPQLPPHPRNHRRYSQAVAPDGQL
jgi:hypothetical protein